MRLIEKIFVVAFGNDAIETRHDSVLPDLDTADAKGLRLGSSALSIVVVRPTGIEPVLRVPETLVISFSLRARRKFYYHRVGDQSTRALTTRPAMRTSSS
jgi:hypothetical protein